jgi:hypothetical protein
VTTRFSSAAARTFSHAPDSAWTSDRAISSTFLPRHFPAAGWKDGGGNDEQQRESHRDAECLTP